jgi:aminoglycoside phosphotransferase (APT) family kinase protein
MTTGNPRSDGAGIDAALVRRLIAAQFPRWADLPVRPVEVGGWDNRTFHLGPRMTVRLPSAAHYASQVEKEHRWLPKLAPLLPLPIPVPLAKGAPAEGYPWQWSVYRWLEGEAAAVGRISDLRRFAISLAGFLGALQRVDPAGGPSPGRHNFFRGGPLTVYDAETRQAIAALARSTTEGVPLSDGGAVALSMSLPARLRTDRVTTPLPPPAPCRLPAERGPAGSLRPGPRPGLVARRPSSPRRTGS